MWEVGKGMNRFELSQFLTNLANYYERKTPSAGTTELWFSKVQRIPGESLKWIEDQIESSNELFPRNVPGTMWACFKTWQEANPDKVARRQDVFCGDGCDGGILYARKKKDEKDAGDNPVTYTYVFGCDRCKQGPIGYPRTRMFTLIADGYEDNTIRLPHGAAYYKKIRDAKKAGIKAMMDNLTDKMTIPPLETVKTDLPLLANSEDSASYGGKVELLGGETKEEPSDEELLNVGQI
jgi:hypothetical protein